MYTKRRLVYVTHAFDHTKATLAVTALTVCTPMGSLTLVLPVHGRHRLTKGTEKSSIRVSLRAVPNRRTLNVHHAFCRRSRSSLRTSHWNTFLTFLKQVKTPFDDLLNFQSFCLINRNQGNDDYNAKRIEKPSTLMREQMSQYTSDPADPIFVLNSYRCVNQLVTVMDWEKEIPCQCSVRLP